ncbi:flagellar filament capping protein FliD [uncultured Desulfovibrio sp.]|uniref:flagellar filament capping protein FliD n=1 Tax=uncultured Desulfovibrio sp. TaxID=167968 RepID=UPI002625651D|nr:flagellar filament capping protein FliD [uncultured Desulfovibrio sp.]
MATSISGSIYFSGLDGTGNDWAQTLEQLKQIESMNLTRLEAWKSDWNLRYQGFTKIIDAVSTARTELSSLKNRNSFVSKVVSSTKEECVTGTATADAVDAQHTINVKQVANNAVWANTGHKFTNKTDIINTTDHDIAFKYTFAGKDYSINVPPKTTLDSFINLVNNNKDNPGIKASLIQTSGGYYFQIAGKETGESNSLVIESNELLGFDDSGINSIWESNDGISGDATFTDPSSIAYDFVLRDGKTVTITMDGDSTLQDFVDQINARIGKDTAEIDPATGALNFKNVQAVIRRDASNTDKDNQYKAAYVRVEAGDYNEINNGYMIGENDKSTITFTIKMKDGSTRQITMSGDDKKKDFITKIAAATGNSASMILDDDGKYHLDLSGVTEITASVSGGGSLSGFTFTPEAETLPTGDSLYKQLTTKGKNYELTIAFNKDKLDKEISSSDPDLEKEYMVVMGDGTAQTFTLKGNATYQNLLDELKNHGFTADSSDPNKLIGTGVMSVTLIAGADPGSGYTKELTCENTIAFNDIAVGTATDAANATLETPPQLEYTYKGNNGSDVSFTLPSGSKLEDVVKKLHENSVDVELVYTDADGTEKTISGADVASGSATLDAGTKYTLRVQNGVLSGPGVEGQVVQSDNWSIQKASNAIYTVDNWPMDLESDSNTVSGVIEGLTFTLNDVGQAKLSVATDVNSVQESIQTFIDTVNEVLATVIAFTKYDENAETTTNDPDNKTDSNYSMSLLTSQKGGILQGNYGVQLFDSRFTSVLTDKPAGYRLMTDSDDPLSGDIVSSLSSLGIKVCSDETSENYGLLMIGAPSAISGMTTMDQENYTSMLSEHLDEVIDFFCGPSTPGSSDTSNFRYASSLDGITKAGTYEVSYTVDKDGNITDVFIGGERATNDSTMGSNYFSVASGDAKGTAIYIDNLEPGTHTGNLSIKTGLLDTVDQFMQDELTYVDTGDSINDDSIALKSQNGGLMILQANYLDIMDSIDAKIEREQDRLDTWEQHQKDKFARLQTLLSEYANTQSQLESQLAQLSGSSS